jgi:hypothetical protein
LRDCGPDLGEEVVKEFFLLRHMLSIIQLILEQGDVLVYEWCSEIGFSAKSVYAAFFVVTTLMPTAT